MSAADRRQYAYRLGRYVAGQTTLDLRADATEAGMLADRRARCERHERRYKTWRGSFARRLAAVTGMDSLRPATGPLNAASVTWGWDRGAMDCTVVALLIGEGVAFYTNGTEYWTTE